MTLTAILDAPAPVIWVDPNADGGLWNSIVRDALADTGVQHHMVDVTAIASWSIRPEGIDLRVTLELAMTRITDQMRQTLKRCYWRRLIVTGHLPDTKQALSAQPHPVLHLPQTPTVPRLHAWQQVIDRPTTQTVLSAVLSVMAGTVSGITTNVITTVVSDQWPSLVATLLWIISHS